MSRWLSTGWAIRAKGARHLFSMIGAIGGYSSAARIAWRGHSSASYDLVSSMQRLSPQSDEHELRARELRLLSAARDWGLGYGQGGWASDHQLLADLQHYGTATRLIDVSSNPMTALWFACQEPLEGDDRDGVLIALNTAHWQRFGRRISPPGRAVQDNPLGWEFEGALRSGRPFVVESLVPNERLRAQEGYFVAGAVPAGVHPSSPFRSIEVSAEILAPGQLEALLTQQFHNSRTGGELAFAAVIIPAKLKQRVLLRLQNSYNRRPSVLFPDFGGFRQYSGNANIRKDRDAGREAFYFDGYAP